MVGLTGKFNRLNACKVLVAGDLMLDSYTIGKARRISPEAPVAVVNVQREENLPGGAGNVILNLVSLGAHVVVLGRIGKDSAGHILRQMLTLENTEVTGIFEQPGFPTPVKNRIIADNQQIVRIDHETVMPLDADLEQRIIDALPELLQGVTVVAISDYGKGFLSHKLLQALIAESKKRGIPTIADPKGIDFTKYSGATVIKPNLGEAYAAANVALDTPLEHAAEKVLALTKAETVMITRSEAGISLFHKSKQREDFPVKPREVKDVTGAGDTVLAVLTCALANQLTLGEAAQLSNVAAGIAIEHIGCARVSLSQLARRLLEDDIANKVFDGQYLMALQGALKGQRTVLLSLSSQQGMTSTIFHTIRQLTNKAGRDLLVYINDDQPDTDFVNLLASLREVYFILLHSESLKQLCEVIEPEEVIAIEDDHLVRPLSIRELLATV